MWANWVLGDQPKTIDLKLNMNMYLFILFAILFNAHNKCKSTKKLNWIYRCLYNIFLFNTGTKEYFSY